MPQFDFSTFSSQIFWLAICFSALYFSMSRIFLPRIKHIMQERNAEINKNEAARNQIEKQIDEIKETTEKLRETAKEQYKTSIEQAQKQNALYKEEGMQKLHFEIIAMVEESELKIADLRESSHDRCLIAAAEIAEKINKKLFLGKLDSDSFSHY